MRSLFIFLAVTSMFLVAACNPKTKEDSKSKEEVKVVEDGRLVSFHYNLTVDGELIESSQNKAPLLYKHGSDQIITGLTKQLEGLRAGDKKSIVVTPEEGYGLLNPNAFQEVARSFLPKNVQPKVGMFIQVSGTDGRNYKARIAEIKKDKVVLNFNHPLAGKTLNFDIEIISID